MAQEDEDGFITRSLANPWISLPYALVSGLTAASSPAGARGAHVFNQGLVLGAGGEKRQSDDRRRQRLSTALETLSSATAPSTSTKTGVDPDKTTFELPSIEGERLSQAMPENMFNSGGQPLAPAEALPTYRATEQKAIFNPRQQELIKVVGKEDPASAIRMMSPHVFREPKAPHVFGSAETGYHSLDNETNAVTPLVPGVPRAVRESTPPRPVFSTQGGENVSSVFDPVRREWVTTRGPTVAAPEKPMSPEDRAFKQSQIAVNQARVQQIQSAISIARSAKSQTVGQLGAALNALNNMASQGLDMENPEIGGLIKQAQTAILTELAARGRGATTPAASGTGGGEQVFNDLPPASQFRGRKLIDPDTKVELRSDGVNWLDPKGQVYRPTQSAPASEY